MRSAATAEPGERVLGGGSPGRDGGGGRGDAGRRGLRPAHRSVAARAARVLLPDARLGTRRRRPGAGDPGPGLAVLRRVRGPGVAADLAVPDRHERLPAGAGEPQPPAAARRAWAARPATRTGPLDAARPEVPWLEPFPDALLGAASADPAAIVTARHSMRLALIAALQYLPGRQRAVLILRDVLMWRAAEVAELFGISTAAVNSVLQRARAGLQHAAPVGTRSASLPTPASESCSTSTRRRSRTPT